MLRNKLYSLNVILCFALENQCRVSENPYDCIINDLSFFRWSKRNVILKRAVDWNSQMKNIRLNKYY